MRSVHAVRLARTGSGPSLTTVDQPSVAPAETVVRMRFAGVNPLDLYVAAGQVAGDAPRPRTLGVEGYGTMDGGPVVVYGCGVGLARDGTWAERVRVPDAALVPVPAGVDPRQAAVAGVTGRTAVRVTRDLAEVGPRDRVVVLGAAGGVGSAIVTLARLRGAEVWGCTTDPEKVSFLKTLGAVPVVTDAGNLTTSIGAAEPTVVIDPLGGAWTGAALKALVPRGRLVLFGASAGAETVLDTRGLYRAGLTIRTFGGTIESVEEVRTGIADALALMATGDWMVPVPHEIPLQQYQEAMTLLSGRHLTGRAVLNLSDED